MRSPTRLLPALTLLIFGWCAGLAMANGRHPQVQLGDIPVDLLCHALDQTEYFVGNARVVDSREVEVKQGIATLIVPLGNISLIELQPVVDMAAIFVPASLTYASAAMENVQIRVADDSGTPLLVSGVIPGEAAISIELRRCQRIEVLPGALDDPQPDRERTGGAKR
jgi:hypothetical protein